MSGILRIGRAVIRTILILVLTSVPGCGGGGGTGGVSVSTSATPVGAMASLAWDPVQDSSVTAYYVHYGKQPAGQAGTCDYEDARFVSAPSAMITGLDPNTRYYFAVSAYNGLESACSNEVSAMTPASSV